MSDINPANMQMSKPVVWSCGGGVQSTAIAALICQGRLPKPDLAVIADTGREYSPVWDYLRDYVTPALAEAGVTLNIAGHDLATVDLYSGKDGDTLLIPAYTDKAGSGKAGQLPKYCSQEWKVRVIQRFCKAHGIKDADQWIGYTTDEMARMKVYREEGNWQHLYPLIALKMRRSDCYGVIENMGWPEPPRSACFMCPYRSDQEWQVMKDESPKDFQAAVELEKDIQQQDPNAFLNQRLIPLDEIEFSNEPDLFEKPCNAAGCFT